MYECKICDYHNCKKCYSVKRKFSGITMLCRNYHDLKYETKLEPPYGLYYRCDECKEPHLKISMGVFHCAHC